MNAGRKRTFAIEEALDKAMRVFWQNGYSGTSLSDLTSELGINKPSLYAAFGNKEKLFEASLAHYMTEYGMPRLQHLGDSSNLPLRERLQVFLYGLIELHTESKTPKGCFFVKSSCESGSIAFPGEITSTLREYGAMNEKLISGYLRDELDQGTFKAGTQLKEITGYLLSVMYGLAVQARGGKTKAELQTVADFAINTFPFKD